MNHAIESTQGIHPYDGSFQRCANLIAKHAPLLMRVGWNLPEERKKHCNLSAAQRREIGAARLAGRGTLELMAKYGCSRTTVQLCVKNYKDSLLTGAAGRSHRAAHG